MDPEIVTGALAALFAGLGLARRLHGGRSGPGDTVRSCGWQVAEKAGALTRGVGEVAAEAVGWAGRGAGVAVTVAGTAATQGLGLVADGAATVVELAVGRHFTGQTETGPADAPAAGAPPAPVEAVRSPESQAPAGRPRQGGSSRPAGSANRRAGHAQPTSSHTPGSDAPESRSDRPQAGGSQPSDRPVIDPDLTGSPPPGNSQPAGPDSAD